MANPIRVLIADDNVRSRNGLRALLGTARLTAPVARSEDSHNESWPQVEVVGEAVDGREAVRRIKETRPDVVLMDVRMPVMDGLEATRLIKSQWPGVRVVLLTLYAPYRAEALATGADAFLVKGCPNEELFAAILNIGNTQSNSRC